MSREMIWQEAASWVNLLNGPLFDAEAGARFDRWMAVSEDHRLAFAELSALWQDEALETALVASADADQSIQPPASAWYWPQGPRLALAAVVVLAVCLFALVQGSRMLPQHYQTMPGELRRVVVADGSIIELGGNSLVEVQYLPWSRAVRLARGEADFHVVRDENRPFTVAAGAASVRVMGTVFHVDRQAGTTAVQVTSGAVQVGNSHTAQTLRPGQAARVSSAELRVGKAQTDDLQWQSGWHVAENIPLADLVEKLRRYSNNEIIIPNNTLGKKLIFGRFKTDEVESTLNALESMDYVKIYRINDKIILY